VKTKFEVVVGRPLGNLDVKQIRDLTFVKNLLLCLLKDI
jgi:hypothetical protein